MHTFSWEIFTFLTHIIVVPVLSVLSLQNDAYNKLKKNEEEEDESRVLKSPPFA
jgi:hypothetical protein